MGKDHRHLAPSKAFPRVQAAEKYSPRLLTLTVRCPWVLRIPFSTEYRTPNALCAVLGAHRAVQL